jgi:hypothetical protein
MNIYETKTTHVDLKTPPGNLPSLQASQASPPTNSHMSHQENPPFTYFSEPPVFEHWISCDEYFAKYLVQGPLINTKCSKCHKGLLQNMYFLYPSDQVHYALVKRCTYVRPNNLFSFQCSGKMIPIDEGIPFMEKHVAQNIFELSVYPQFKKKWSLKAPTGSNQIKKPTSNSSTTTPQDAFKMCCWSC